MKEAIANGKTFTKTNDTTGTVATQAELALKAPGYITDQLATTTFQSFLAIFEQFLADFLRLWLTAHPKSLLPTEPIDFKAFLDAPDKPALIAAAVNRKVYGLFYQRPAAWFAYVEKKARLGCPSADEVARFTEAKATRSADANGGIATAAYLEKAGVLARAEPGSPLDVPEFYHRGVWDLLRKVVADMADAAGRPA